MAKKVKLGNVYAIPLPNGKFAFGRVMEDGALSIYNGIYDSISDFNSEAGCFRVLSVYKNYLTDGKWPYICNIPFSSSEEAFPPPSVNIDIITGEFRIYDPVMAAFKELSTQEEYEECLKLEVLAVWSRNHIEDMLMGNSIWDDIVWGLPRIDFRNRENWYINK